MNAAAVQLDRFLSEADPATARIVEQIIFNVLSLRSQSGEASRASSSPYQLPSRSLRAHAGLDLTKLAHVDEEF